MTEKASKQIIVFPRGQISARDKERLMRFGILAIEADDPSKIVTIVPGVPLIETNDMLTIALKCLADTVKDENASPASKFTKALASAAHAMNGKPQP